MTSLMIAHRNIGPDLAGLAFLRPILISCENTVIRTRDASSEKAPLLRGVRACVDH